MLKIESITLKSKIVHREGNVVSDMDGDKVMLNISKGKYYNLGQLGGFIWEQMETPIEISEIISSLLSSYEVEETVCKQQVLSFIKSLLDEELVEVINER